MRSFVAGIFIITFSLSSSGQIDLSSELLLRPSEKAPPNEAGLGSGRYQVKKTKKLPEKKVPGSSTESSPGDSVVLPSSNLTTTTTTSSTTSTTLKGKNSPSALDQVLFAPTTTTTTSTTTTLPAVTPVEKSVEKVDSEMTPPLTPAVLVGVDQAVVEAYREQIHPDDIRMNHVEIDILSGVISNSSQSNYSFRSYSSFSPKLQMGANIWITPFLGYFGNYTASLGANVSGDPATDSRSAVRHEWTDIGVNLRKFFGMSRKSNSLEFGILLSEYKFSVPGDDLYRARLKSSGVGVHLKSRIPVAPSYSWIVGGKLFPRLQHSEQETGINYSSGGAGESSRVDLTIGGEIKMSRENQVLWDLTGSLEKNQFAGQADLADPETGLKPKGVSIENTFLIFSLGYRWGQ